MSSLVKLRVLTGPFGANKVFTQIKSSKQSHLFFFVGDQLESANVPPKVAELQDPTTQVNLLSQKFPNSSIWVVMPSRLEAGFACFDHFLNKTTVSGEPLGYQGKGLKACSQLWGMFVDAMSEKSVRGVENVVLAGFSKGGVVLNQVLSELAYFSEYLGKHEAEGDCVGGKDAPNSLPNVEDGVLLSSVCLFMQKISEVHYLDVGLNSRGAYYTDPQSMRFLGEFAAQNVLRIFFHGTPRQWSDPKRPWLALEKARSKVLMEENNIPVVERVYLEGVEQDLLMHFRILEEFSPKV